jgi:serine/threonine protein kinase/Tol biopolymer transport system component
MGLALRRLTTSQTKAPDDRPCGPSFFSVGASVAHFRLLEWLGRGERGFDVYLAHDLAQGRRVALKVLVSDRPLRGEERHLLRREAEAVSALRHPNLCPVHEVGETQDGVLFIAMACCDGQSLAERIDRGPLEIADAVDLAAQVAEGLSIVHDAGIVHRTLKPSDVLVSLEGRVWITDFGLGRLDERTLISGESGEAPSRYLSPEQVRGAEPDARSDVWGLGAILYEMVTGRPAFPQGPVAGAADPAPMSRLREGVPPDLQAIVARALAFRPSERYANAREMRDELRGGARPAVWRPIEVRGDFGPYRIGELIGGGGMGVVYRAQDRRLGRSVAIKLLPPELTRDPVSKARFLQEARAASALDHPNLCTVYEVGEAGASQLYLAMPCYDGETLRNRLDARGALPVPEALDITVQVLKGLGKAHRHGIVHRDVKPANLMVTEDGVVKILDFGIAKLAGVAAELTRTGARVGTPAYMSPEQDRGEEVDARTDLWAVGVILYEMLAGVRPASGAVPAPIRQVRPEVPAEVERILRRLIALRKEDRYETAEAVLADLRILLGTISGTGTATRDLAPVPRRTRRLRAAAALALGILGVAAATGAGYWLRWDGEDRSPALFATYSRITSQEGRELFPSLSPDGNFFAYAKVSGGSSDIHLQRIGGNPINLTPKTPWEDTQPAFSPDGEQIAFRSGRDGGGLFVMGATGESVRRLTDFGFNPSWSPDGKRIVFATEGISHPAARSSVSQLWVLDIATSALRRVVEEDAVQPSWSPDGSRIAYWGATAEGKRTISTVSASGGEPVRATADGWNPVWSADGAHLYFASDRGGSMNLWRLRIDEPSGRVRGVPQPVTTPSPWSAMLSPSRDGRRILYVSETGERSDVWMLTRDE